MTSAKRILVVDDDPAIAATVQRILRTEGYEVDTAVRGLAALEHARNHKLDVIVLDVMMPGVDGIEVCRRLRSSQPGVAILMLSARTGTRDRVQGLDSGADDYLAKPFAYEELLARVRALLRRTAPASESGGAVMTFGDLSLDIGTHDVRLGDVPLSLTATEFRLLEFFMRNPNQVLSRSQILTSVWDDDVDDDNVVAVYVSYLRGKLDSAGGKRLIHTVRGFGYALKET